MTLRDVTQRLGLRSARPGSFRVSSFITRGQILSTGAGFMVANLTAALGGIVTARALGPDGKGVVTAVLAWPQICAFVLLLGMGSASSLRVAESPEDSLHDALGNALLYVFSVGLLGTAVCFLVLPDALDHLGPDAASATRLALIGLSLSMLSEICAAINLALGNTRRYNLARITGGCTVLTLSVVLVVAGAATPHTVVGATIIGGFASASIAASGLPWRRMKLAVRKLMSDLKFGVRVYLTSMLGLVNVRLDILLMTAFLGASQIGFYAIAFNAMFPIAVVTSTLATLIMPAIGRARGEHGKDSSVHLSIIRRTALRYTLLTATIAALVAAAAPWGIPLVFGHAFEPAVALVWLLLPGYVAQSYAYIVDAGMVGMRKPWVGNAAQGAGVVITAALLPILLPRYGATGAAITSTLSYTATAAISVWALGRVWRGVGAGERAAADADAAAAAAAAVPVSPSLGMPVTDAGAADSAMAPYVAEAKTADAEAANATTHGRHP
jgi:O-antigen/teichoic acid export membrane protein